MFFLPPDGITSTLLQKETYLVGRHCLNTAAVELEMNILIAAPLVLLAALVSSSGMLFSLYASGASLIKKSGTYGTSEISQICHLGLPNIPVPPRSSGRMHMGGHWGRTANQKQSSKKAVLSPCLPTSSHLGLLCPPTPILRSNNWLDCKKLISLESNWSYAYS